MALAKYKIITANTPQELEQKINQANAYRAVNISGYSAQGLMALMELIPDKQ